MLYVLDDQFQVLERQELSAAGYVYEVRAENDRAHNGLRFPKERGLVPKGVTA